MADSRGIPRLLTAVPAALIALLLWAAPALAQSCEAPPGTAGVDQYCESIPSAGGDRGPADRDRGSQPIPRSTRSELAREGEAGRAILGANPRDGKPSRGGKGADEAVSDDPFGAIGSAVGDGSGKAFVWVLLLIALLGGAAAWLRYRRGAGEDAAA